MDLGGILVQSTDHRWKEKKCKNVGGPFKWGFVGILVKHVPEIPGSKKRKGKKGFQTPASAITLLRYHFEDITDKTQTENEARDPKIAKQFNTATWSVHMVVSAEFIYLFI